MKRTVLALLLAACGDDRVPPFDAPGCDDPSRVQIAIAPIAAMTATVNGDIDVSGTVDVPSYAVIHAIELAVSAEGTADPVYGTRATFTQPRYWTAKLTLAQLLAPVGPGKIVVTARVVTSRACSGSASSPVNVARPDASIPQDAGS